FGMIRREVADPVELTMLGDRIVPTVLELTRELSGAWVEGAGRRSVGFSYRAVHERDHWTCAYCGRSVSKTPARETLLATVDHVLPSSRGGESSWTNLVSACKECNNRKADRTPEEAGLPLRVEPYDPPLSYPVPGHGASLAVQVRTGAPSCAARHVRITAPSPNRTYLICALLPRHD